MSNHLLDLRKPCTPRDKKYLAWIRKLPCINGHQAPSEPHHEGDRGIGIKASDYSTLPLCNRCHRERHQVGKGIYGLWGVDHLQVISELQKRYTQETGKLLKGE